MKGPKKIKVNAFLTPDVIAEIDRIAEERALERGQVVRQLVLSGLKQVTQVEGR